MKRYLIILLSVIAVQALSAREIYSLNDNWKFFFRHENTSDAARRIAVPHTWNLDALTGTRYYMQTTADYMRDLYIPSEWRDKRLFLRFYGVQTVADVFINGDHIGEHRGGYTAFTFEITDKVRYDYDNALLVMVSNALENDVLPLSTEMNLYGGIYRDVELIVTDRTNISPTFYGTDGLLVNQTSVTRERVDASITLYLSSTHDATCSVSVSLTGPDGYVAVRKSLRAKTDGKAVTIPFAIENPELWSVCSPKLYTVEAVAGNDTLTVKTGFRRIEVTPEDKFELNGRTVPVRGVSLYHDRTPVGNALRESDYDEDLRMIRDAGANALRSAVAPHAPYLYDRCDEQGVLVWVDFPFVQAPFLGDVAYIPSQRLKDNGRQQLREIIAQNYNHPSIVMWGIFSLLKPKKSGDMLDYIRELNETAKKLDPSRPTVACSNQDGDINFITDLIVWQQSLGWDKGRIADLKIWQEMLAEQWKHLRQAVCYGSGDTVGQPSDIASKIKTRSYTNSEVWQTRFHEGYTDQLADNTVFWGVWINNMFDFGSTRYLTSVQNAGLVSLDHRQPKDIFYLYRALWNTSSPTLRIKGKQFQHRTRTNQTIRFYSSVDNPTLTVNGDTVRVHNVGRCRYESDSMTMQGRSTIEVTAGDLTDRTTFTIGNVLKHR